MTGKDTNQFHPGNSQMWSFNTEKRSRINHRERREHREDK